MTKEKNKWWVRWYSSDDHGSFTLYTPWWETGFTLSEPEAKIFVAAIWADDLAEVEEILYGCYDKRPEPGDIVISFCLPLTFDITKNESGRFPWTERMQTYWDRGEYRQEG